MKLTAAVISRVEEQREIQILPDEHPVMPQLVEAFGEHTFFLDAAGLNIVEPDPSSDGSNGVVIKLAAWNEERTELQAHEPEEQPFTVDLSSGAPKPSH